jgi:LPXTG-motif cell wall-anchored protein
MGKMVRTLLRCILWKGWLVLACWLVCSYRTGNPGHRNQLQALYNKAYRLFHLNNPTDATDSLALATFQKVIVLAEITGSGADSLVFNACLHSGILLAIRTNYTQAIEAYRRAQGIKQRNPRWSDSMLYQVMEHTGSAWYHLNNFDSASYFLLQAEILARRFPRVPVQERLYNDLGVLYYENGNFLQSRNYFTQGLEFLKKSAKQDPGSVASLHNNIAASCYKLGLYQQAIAIYKNAWAQKMYSSWVSMNMGLAYKAMGNYSEALKWFRLVNYTTLPQVFNEMADAHLLLNHVDSASYYLTRFKGLANAGKVQPNNIYYGMHHLYRGDLLVKHRQYDMALMAYQKAITIFSGHFRDTDPLSNPQQFTGTFTSYRLFDALFKKATTFEALYKAQHNEAQLQAALNTYTSAIALLRYIEKSYDTDESKLFLKKNNQQAYENAVAVCMQLHDLHPGPDGSGYAQQAFAITERNKASVMYSGLKEKGFRKLRGIDPVLTQQERNIKFNLARLSIRSDQTSDSTALVTLANEKAAYEIQLGQVQHAIEKNNVYYQLKYSESWPRPDSIKRLLTHDQAVISFYATANTLNVFVITRNAFTHTRIDSFATIQQNTREWLTALQNPEAGKRFKGGPWGERLYQQLVKPVQALAGDKPEWIIIPDNILYYLPFESLPASAGPDAKPLLETTEISYQFGARFMVANATREQPSIAAISTLAFAPFAQTGMPFPHATYKYMQQLPASAQEIAHLPGRSFTNRQATKEQFLQHISQYPVVHLATHAIADTGNSAASFIAFYPQHQQPTQDALYLEELYGLDMDSTQLIIISACETGNGQLINSEGVLSLTRGFAYAGCASMVNSLWKADDEATAEILHQFHLYLQKGYTKSKALRQAKLDYLHGNALHKAPGYWAHLIITGDTQPLVKAHTGYRWLLVVGVVVAVLLGGMFFLKRRKKST